jgi:hypothetical protein
LRHWRIALLLGFAGAISAALLLPYLFALTPDLSAKIHVPMPVFALAQSLQAGLLVGLAAWMGLRLGYRYGLDAPRLRALLHAGPSQGKSSRWPSACAIGGLVALACVLVSVASPLVARGGPHITPTWWQGLLASAYGGVVEEVLCRLFVMSLFVWTLARLSSTIMPTAWMYWTAIVCAALLFGAGHLPVLAQMHAFTPINVTQVISLNALCGVAYGWLFWRDGLEYAMVAHFSSDIVLHVLAPLTVSF